jgi:hypothetical protein
MAVGIKVINYLKVYRFMAAYIADHDGDHPSVLETAVHFNFNRRYQEVSWAYDWLRYNGYIKIAIEHGIARVKLCRGEMKTRGRENE